MIVPHIIPVVDFTKLDQREREASQALSRELGQQQDSAMRQAITNHLGHSDWTIFEVQHRLRLIEHQDSELKTVTMDGQPIYQYGPVECSIHTEDKAWIFKVTRGHRILNAPEIKP